jgi:subtilisin family serine protease
MTSAHQKLTGLAIALTMVLATDALAVASTAAGGVRPSGKGSCASDRSDGLSPVVLVADRGRTAALASQVRAAGGRVCSRFGRMLEARIPVRAAHTLERDSSSLRPSPRPYALGSGEGVAATNADAWQARGLSGAGTTVAVIDLGFGGLREAQAAGELPSSVVSVDYCPGQFSVEQHGTAVAEVVADEAPAAQLYLICVDSLPALAHAEAFVVAHGIRIVNHSVGWFNSGPGDGTGGPGTPDAIVADARAHGVLWVNAAGNETQRYWRGTFTDADADGLLDFAPGANGNFVSVPPGGAVCVFLRWYEWPQAQHDYDLVLHDPGSGLGFPGDESPLPLESACWRNPRIWDAQATAVEITVRAPGGVGSAPLELFVEGAGPIAHSTAAGSIADPASSPNALAVGAICWQSGVLEPYSSQGPTIDGRTKPELVAPDSVSSPIYGAFSRCGSSGFTGTSAAAPHVAGAAALVEQRFPSYNLAQIQSYLVQHAADLGPAGRDNLFGAGKLMMPAIAGPTRPAARALAARGGFGGAVRLPFMFAASPMEVGARVEVFRGTKLVASLAQGFRAVDQPTVASATWRAPASASAASAFRFCVTANDTAGAVGERSCAPITLRRP